MEYKLDTEHLIPIDIDDLNNWEKKYSDIKTTNVFRKFLRKNQMP